MRNDEEPVSSDPDESDTGPCASRDAHSSVRLERKHQRADRPASHLMGSVLDDIPSALQRGASEQLHVGIVHGVNPEEAQPLLDDLAEALEPQVTVLGEIGPGLGVHVGPGTVGVCWLRLPA